jgi:hypothetical protein
MGEVANAFPTEETEKHRIGLPSRSISAAGRGRRGEILRRLLIAAYTTLTRIF